MSCYQKDYDQGITAYNCYGAFPLEHMAVHWRRGQGRCYSKKALLLPEKHIETHASTASKMNTSTCHYPARGNRSVAKACTFTHASRRFAPSTCLGFTLLTMKFNRVYNKDRSFPQQKNRAEKIGHLLPEKHRETLTRQGFHFRSTSVQT